MRGIAFASTGRRSDGRCCFWSSISKPGGRCLVIVGDMPGLFFNSRFFCSRPSCFICSLPSFSAEIVDLRVNYFGHARWFFGSFLAVLLVSLVKNVVMSGSLQGPFDLAFHLFWIAGAIIATTTRRDLFHKAFVCVAGVSFVVYIGALFAELH